MASNERFDYLFNRHFEKSTSPEEKLELMQMINSGEHDEQLRELIDTAWEKSFPDYKQDEEHADAIFNSIVTQEVKPAVVRKMLPWRRIVAAACLIGLLVMGYWIYQNNNKGPQGNNPSAIAEHNDIAPGGNKAVLTLANGKQVVLDSSKGMIAKEGDVNVINGDGQLSYEGEDSKDGGASTTLSMTYNTISTPKGGKYQLVLSDGSKVWLNAASSIRYPVKFNNKERLVEITGEAYFEVVHNAKQPFRVKTSQQVFEDVGTAFNVNCYADEPILKTTVAEGAVKVDNKKVLTAGQQSQYNAGNLIVVQNADVEEAIAWKNGLFQFTKANIETVMKQVARWYDVEVVYSGQKPTGYYRGKISRNVTAAEMLKVIEASGVKFKIEGKKITVL